MERIRQWTIFTALAVVAVLVAGWMLAIKPQRSHAADLRSQAAGVEQSNDQLRNQLSSLKAQAKDLPKQQARLAEIAKKIPNNPALPTLIRNLSDAADSAGVDLVSLAPAQPVALVSAVAAPAGRPAAGSAGSAVATPQVEQVPVTLSVTGSYFNLEQFVSNLEQLDRAMIVDGWSMSPGAKGDASKPDKSQVTAQIQARVFMAPDTTPAAAAKAPSSSVGG